MLTTMMVQVKVSSGILQYKFYQHIYNPCWNRSKLTQKGTQYYYALCYVLMLHVLKCVNNNQVIMCLLHTCISYSQQKCFRPHFLLQYNIIKTQNIACSQFIDVLYSWNQVLYVVTVYLPSPWQQKPSLHNIRDFQFSEVI